MEAKIKQKGQSDKPLAYGETNFLIPEEYLMAFKQYILTCDTPMTISIQGEWGCGKTSFVNLVIGDKEVEEKCIAITFDVWDYAQFNLSEQSPLVMLNCLCDDISITKNKFNKLFKSLASVGSRYLAFKFLSKPEGFDNIFNHNVISELKALKNNFSKIVEKRLIHDKKEKIVIFIDNLDRISPPKALEVIEVLKTFLDSKNCIFILAVDYDVITKSACEKYGEKKGKVFFDKIVQLPFTMPMEYYNIDDYFKEKLNTTLPDDIPSDIVSKYLECAKVTLGTNPRTINRLINSFVVTYMVDKYGVIDEKDYSYEITVLLFQLLCIKYTSMKLYKYLFSKIPMLNEKNASECKKIICDDFDNIKTICSEDKINDKRLMSMITLFANLMIDAEKELKNNDIKLYDVLTKSGAISEQISTYQ